MKFNIYIVKHLCKYNNFLTESVDYSEIIKNIEQQNNELTHDLFDFMADFIDSGYNITLKSSTGDIKAKDIIDKTSALKYFTPSIRSGGNIRSRFSIVIHSVGNDYKNLVGIMDDMTSVIDRLRDMGWSLFDFRIGNKRAMNDIGSVDFGWMGYYFSKPDVKVEGWSIDLKMIKSAFSDKGLSVGYVDEEKSIDGVVPVRVEFEVDSYNGALYDNMDDRFDHICDVMGFDSYDYNVGERVVYFFYKED